MAENLAITLEELLQDEAVVRYLGEANDVEEIKTFFEEKGVAVDDDFAQQMIENRDKVLASDDIPEEYLELVSGGGLRGALVSAIKGVTIGGAVGFAVTGLLVGGTCGALVGGVVAVAANKLKRR